MAGRADPVGGGEVVVETVSLPQPRQTAIFQQLAVNSIRSGNLSAFGALRSPAGKPAAALGKLSLGPRWKADLTPFSLR